MNLNLLKVFDVVMCERSMTRAAERLHLTQSAVSNAVGKLREELADDLFVRTPLGVNPTKRAEAIWPHVRAALRQVEHIVAGEEFDSRTATVSFRFVASDYAQHYLLPPFIRHVMHSAPNVALNFFPYAIDRVEEMLREDAIDVATGIFPRLNEEFPNMVLDVIPYVCVMRKGHPLANDVVTPESFARARHLGISVSGSGTSAIEGHLEGYGIKRRIALTLNQISFAPKVVADTDLLALLPENMVTASQYAHLLHAVPTPVPIPGNQVILAWHRRNEEAQPHKWLRETLVRCTKSAPRTDT